MKSILCPVDFSAASLNALEFAVALAQKFGAAMHLINVYTESDLERILREEDIGRAFQNQIETAEIKLQAIRDAIAGDPSVRNIGRLTCGVKTGELAEVLAGVAAELHTDLIVVGTTGVSKLREHYFGSKALNLIRHAAYPVLCVPDTHQYHGINRIVYASDYQEEDKIAIPFTAAFAEALDADLEVLHISHHDHLIDKAIYDEFLEEIRLFAKYDRLAFTREVFSDTARGIIHHMNASGSDLLVLLDKQRSWLSEFFHSSLSQDLALFSIFPFLVMRIR